MLTPFLIGKFEVTQAQWQRGMRTNPSGSKGVGLAEFPVEQVSWEDCQEFCGRTGLKLPTEAQWEYACRGGTTGPYAGTGRLEDMGWYSGSSGNTHPVGEKQPNGFGLHDMHGNVAEWCEDVYEWDFYSTPEAAGVDPVCTSGAEGRVSRGGGFLNPHDFARCAFRNWSPPDRRVHYIGFRVAVSPF